MGIFKNLSDIFSNKKLSFDKPEFIKEFNSENAQMQHLEVLLERATDEETKKQIENDIKIFRYGMIGEEKVAYELKNAHMPILILHDLYLTYNGLNAQIDYVVIDQSFILVIECKNMVGDIEIKSTGEFIRHFKNSSGKYYRKEGIYSPISQNEKHVELIKDILKNEDILDKKNIDCIKHKIVIANEKTILNDEYATKEVKEQIIKCDMLIDTIKNLHEEGKETVCFSEKTMRSIADAMLKYDSEHIVDYSKKYKLDDKNNEEAKTEVLENQNSKEEVTSTVMKNEQDIEKDPLYIKLKQYRWDKSREEGNEVNFLYSNLVLEELVKSKPSNMEELIKIKGFGKAKCEKYGEDIIRIIKEK